VRSGRAEDPTWRALRYLVFELPGADGSFAHRAQRLRQLSGASPQGLWQAVMQHEVEDRSALRLKLAQVVAGGGEGLMLHRADAPYQTGRSGALLKMKPVHDADAVVLAHLPGRGRHQGRLGALLVRAENGAEFRLGTGFSDALRDAPPPVGAVLTYTHRGHTPSGLPRFASFLRLRPLGT
jgi:DNA ligase-1